ncbi:MAG: EAL domain-containing protein, partial [Geminicoccaceae bacterium]
AQHLGIKTIAECVESQANLTALRDLGVDFAQGIAIARPGPFGQDFSLPTEVEQQATLRTAKRVSI